jgi:hypothetical protein
MGEYVRQEFDWDKLNKEREMYKDTWEREETLEDWAKNIEIPAEMIEPRRK